MADVSKINGYNLKDAQAREDLNNKADKEHTHEEYAESSALESKQDKLVSGSNIKTINGQSILGSGDVTITGGNGDLSDYITKDEVDAGLSTVSTNPVQNRVICKELAKRAALDDVYVEVETSTANTNVEIMTLSDEGVEVASVEEYTYTTPNTNLGNQAKAISFNGQFLWVKDIYVTRLEFEATTNQRIEIAVYDVVRKHPNNASNFDSTLTKVRSCGICTVKNNKAIFSFPNGEYVSKDQLILAVGEGIGRGTKDKNVTYGLYYYGTNEYGAAVGSTFTSPVGRDWDGVYTMTYTFEQPEEVTPTTNHTITNNLSNASNSNNTTTVTEGSSYSATISANSGCTLSTVTVTMGGTDITSSCYSNGAINISNVTGNIVITVTAIVTSVTTYSITNNLSNATNSNKAVSVKESSSYTATITANSGYTLDSVTVTMGGSDITSTAYLNGTINIASVTGNIVITATTTLNSSGGSTVKRKIKEVIPEMLSDINCLKNTVANIGSSNSRGARIPINKYFILTVDDVERSFLTIADRLISIGFYPALALKMESINSGAITWAEVKQLQDMGFEIAFHGMSHGHTPYGTAPNNDDVMIADIAEFKALCKDNGIDIVGYCGPNHYPLPVGAFKEFEWARSAYGVGSYGWNIDYANASRMSNSFASIEAGVSFDWPNAPSEETITKMIALAQHENLRDNYYLTPMCHSQNIVANIDSYMQIFEGWIAQGLTPMRCRDAVMQSLWKDGSIGNNSTFEIQAGTATNPYWVVAGNGIVKSSTAK